ncbi:MAG: DUF1573 domain-containing protein [Planctomycetota bacterium]|nr:DUF1573 domain-containing protein [Planctomycetota bacterium]
MQPIQTAPRFLRTVLSLLPAALIALTACTAEKPSVPASEDHSGHDHGPGEHGASAAKPEPVDEHAGHDHGPGEHGASAAKPEPVDEHAGHDHGPGEHGKSAAEGGKPTAGPVKLPQLPPGIGENEGARLMYEVDQGSHDFGRLMQGEVASHTFSLFTRGNEDLIITQVKPTCGCTVSKVMIESGAPGEGGEMVRYNFGDAIPVGTHIEMPAVLHTKNKNGHQNVRINIFSNDPRGTIQLGLEADVDMFFNLSPRFLNFGRVSIGDVKTLKASISTARGAPVKLEMAEAAMPAGTTAELVAFNADADGRSAQWQLSVTLGPDTIEQNLHRAISLVSDLPIPGEEQKAAGGKQQTYQATISISAQIVGPFTYQPNYISMGLVRPGQVVTRVVTVECHDEEYDLTADGVGVSVVGLPVPGGNGYQAWDRAESFSSSVRPVEGKNAVDVELRLEGLPDGSTGSFRGTMLVTLGHPDKPAIALTITGVCRGGPIPGRGR